MWRGHALGAGGAAEALRLARVSSAPRPARLRYESRLFRPRGLFLHHLHLCSQPFAINDLTSTNAWQQRMRSHKRTLTVTRSRTR
jgi:hypothetical protein